MRSPGGGLREAPLIFERSGRAAAPAACPTTASRSPSSRTTFAGARAATSRGGRARDRSPRHGARRSHLRHGHGLLPARQLHDEAQPARQRARRAAAGIPRSAPAPGGRRSAGRARAHVAPPGDPRRGRGPARGHAAAGGRLAGRADRPHAHARVLRGPGRGARHDHHRGHGARDEPRERDDGGLLSSSGSRRTRAATSTSTTCERR